MGTGQHRGLRCTAQLSGRKAPGKRASREGGPCFPHPGGVSGKHEPCRMGALALRVHLQGKGLQVSQELGLRRARMASGVEGGEGTLACLSFRDNNTPQAQEEEGCLFCFPGPGPSSGQRECMRRNPTSKMHPLFSREQQRPALRIVSRA